MKNLIFGILIGMTLAGCGALLGDTIAPKTFFGTMRMAGPQPASVSIDLTVENDWLELTRFKDVPVIITVQKR